MRFKQCCAALRWVRMEAWRGGCDLCPFAVLLVLQTASWWALAVALRFWGASSLACRIACWGNSAQPLTVKDMLLTQALTVMDILFFGSFMFALMPAVRRYRQGHHNVPEERIAGTCAQGSFPGVRISVQVLFLAATSRFILAWAFFDLGGFGFGPLMVWWCRDMLGFCILLLWLFAASSKPAVRHIPILICLGLSQMVYLSAMLFPLPAAGALANVWSASICQCAEGFDKVPIAPFAVVLWIGQCFFGLIICLFLVRIVRKAHPILSAVEQGL